MKPFLKPIVHSPSALTNRVLIRNSSFLSNNSDYSINNNSSTTNASAVRKKPIFLPKLKTPRSNQLIKNVNFDFFSKKRNLGVNYYVEPSPSKRLSNIEQGKLLDNADNIVRERMNNISNIISTGKRNRRRVALGIAKGISQKNYTINLLKEQRTKINEKELIIEQVVKEFTQQYENDYRQFIDFVANEKRKQQIEEETMNNIKEKKDKKKTSLDEESLLNKRLEETLDRKIREIFTLKSYGSFLHKVFNKTFSFDEIKNGDPHRRNIERVSNDLITIYETKNKFESIPKELKDEQLLLKSYIVFEDKILMALRNKDIAKKETEHQKKIYQKELEQIKLSLVDYESDFKNLKQERNIVNSEMKNFKISQNEVLEMILNCIIELGKDIGTEAPIPQSMDKEHLIDFNLYAKKTLDVLKNKEVLINNLICEIENTIEYGNINEKILMSKCIGEQKKINKKEKQLKIKMIQEELKYQKNQRALKRANKVVIGGRKAPMIYNLKNMHMKFKNKINEKKDEKIDLYDESETEDKKDEV